ncbi:MAG: CBS domain-containing protein [Acidobacteria bacterium]|nr:CBS domain-containing protein [Acidobacteriota bacterium]
MSENVATIDPQSPAAMAAQLMRSKGIHHLVVMRDGVLQGLVSARDLPESVTTGRGRKNVEDVMQTHVVTVGPNTLTTRAANVMRGRAIGSLVVTQRGKVLGIVTVSDLLDLVGQGAGRQPKRAARPILKKRVPHRKQHGSGGAW